MPTRRIRLAAMVWLVLGLTIFESTTAAHADRVPLPRASVATTGSSDRVRCAAGIDPTSGGAGRVWSAVELCYFVEAAPGGSTGALTPLIGTSIDNQSTNQYPAQQYMTPGGTWSSSGICTKVTSGSAYSSLAVGPVSGYVSFAPLPQHTYVYRHWCSNALPTYKTSKDFSVTSSGAMSRSAYASGSAHVGVVYWLGTVDWATGAGIEGPPDWYAASGDVPYVVTPSHECDLVTVSVPVPTYGPGELIPVSTAVSGSAPAGLEVSYRLTTLSSWVNLTPVPGTANISTGTTTVAASSIVFRCRTTASSDYVYQYPGVGAPADDWDVDVLYPAPCWLVSFIWPATQAYESGDSADFVYDIPSGVGPVSIDYVVIDPNGSPASPNSSTSWTSAVSGASGPDGGTITVSSLLDADASQIWFRCRDSGGVHMDRQWSFSWSVGFSSGDPESGDCWSSVGIGLSPSSWVPGLLRGGLCVLRTAIVPSPDSIDDLVDSWRDLMERPPLVYVGVAVGIWFDFWEDAANATTTYQHECLELLPTSSIDLDGSSIDMPSGHACFDSAGSGGGNLPWYHVEGLAEYQSWMEMFLWAGWLWGVVMLVRSWVFV